MPLTFHVLSMWRRGWDSNPRSHCWDACFPSMSIRPLSHLSTPIFAKRHLNTRSDDRQGDHRRSSRRLCPSQLPSLGNSRHILRFHLSFKFELVQILSAHFCGGIAGQPQFSLANTERCPPLTYLPNLHSVRLYNERSLSISTALTLLFLNNSECGRRNDAAGERYGVLHLLRIGGFGHESILLQLYHRMYIS